MSVSDSNFRSRFNFMSLRYLDKVVSNDDTSRKHVMLTVFLMIVV
ncbi:hypothetical protein FM106_04220 [Brachybacterium faecium]|nr:hypothetical protein FM106_04220 [Brachybacterium faecium]